MLKSSNRIRISKNLSNDSRYGRSQAPRNGLTHERRRAKGSDVPVRSRQPHSTTTPRSRLITLTGTNTLAGVNLSRRLRVAGAHVGPHTYSIAAHPRVRLRDRLIVTETCATPPAADGSLRHTPFADKDGRNTSRQLRGLIYRCGPDSPAWLLRSISTHLPAERISSLTS